VAGITPWVNKTHPVKDGEQVKATITNRPSSELQQRTQHLKDRLDSLQAGEAIVTYNASLDTSVLVGHAVYWDVTTLSYKPALAKVEFNNLLGGYVIAQSSYVVGICVNKTTNTVGDIIITGILRSFDFTNGIGSAGDTVASAGAYYLSSSQPGKYTLQKPAVGIYVCFLRGDGVAHVNPTPREVLENHIHYVFDLFAKPSGTITCPASGYEYAFTTVDREDTGWLPTAPIDPPLTGDTVINTPTIDMASTAGVLVGHYISGSGIPLGARVVSIVPNGSIDIDLNATATALAVSLTFQNFSTFPVGASYGYNMDTHNALKLVWPPVPLDQAYLEIDGMGVDSSKYIFDLSNIWWKDECYGRGPWPIEPEATCVVDTPGVPDPECVKDPPLVEEGYVKRDTKTMNMRLYFTKMVFKTASSVVTSLTPAPGSPITLTCDGEPAIRGDLIIDINLGGAIIPGNTSFTALKDVTGVTFEEGYVVTGLKNIDGTITIGIPDVLKGTQTIADGFYRGELTISAPNPSTLQREGNIELSALNGVREDNDGNVFFLSLPKSQNTSLVGKIGIPRTNLPTNPMIKLHFWLLARIATPAVLPDLTLTVEKVPKPKATCVGAKQNLSTKIIETPEILDFTTCGPLSNNDYIEVESGLFSLVDTVPNPDSTYGEIYFTLARSGFSDGYLGDVGILRMGFVISS
jgi:hypothetical protein